MDDKVKKVRMANLVALRRIRGLNQKDAARVATVNSSSYQAFETGRGDIHLRAAVALADFYGVSLDVIAGRKLLKISYEVE